MTGMHDVEREELHALLDEAIDARNRIPSDGLARDSLLARASLLFKRIVGPHGVELHHADDRLSRKPADRLGRLASICVWAGYTLPDQGDGNITRAEACQFANELTDLRITPPKALPDWLKPIGRKLQSPKEVRLIALAVCWVESLTLFFGEKQKESAKAAVADAFGVSSKTLLNWEKFIKKHPVFVSQVEAASIAKHGPGQKCAVLVDGDKNLLVTPQTYKRHLARHGQEFQKFAGKKP